MVVFGINGAFNICSVISWGSTFLLGNLDIFKDLYFRKYLNVYAQNICTSESLLVLVHVYLKKVSCRNKTGKNNMTGTFSFDMSFEKAIIFLLSNYS